MGSTSGSASAPAPAPAPDDDLDLIDLDAMDLEQLAQSADSSWSDEAGGAEWGGGELDSEDERAALRLSALLDALGGGERRGCAEKRALDSRTFVRPRRRAGRPGLHGLLPDSKQHLTYNKYAPVFPLPLAALRNTLATHNGQSEVGAERDSGAERPHALSRPIDIDLSQPANSLSAAFARAGGGCGGSRDSGSMLRSGVSFLNMSPPSLVSSLAEGSPPPDPGASITLSILEERDMSTSFLSTSTAPERDSLLGSLPPSLDTSWRLTSRPRVDLFTPRLSHEAGVPARPVRTQDRCSPPAPAPAPAPAPDMQRTVNLGRRSLELSEIVQARHKLSLARSGLSPDADPPPPPHEPSPPARRDATYKKRAAPDTTLVYLRTSPPSPPCPPPPHHHNSHQEWSQRCAMGGSSDSADTATPSGSSPPEPPAAPAAPPPAAPHPHEHRARHQYANLMQQQASTPLCARGAGAELVRRAPPTLHISPIPPAPAPPAPSPPPTRPALSPARRLPAHTKSPVKLLSVGVGAAVGVGERRSGLPKSKLRHYSSHKELSRVPGAGSAGGMARRGVYGSNPALSPTMPPQPSPGAALQRRDSYTISTDPSPALAPPAPPALVRQGTETLRRPQSQLLLARAGGNACGRGGSAAAGPGGSVRGLAPVQRVGGAASQAQLRVRSCAPAAPVLPAEPAPAPRVSALPRPSRLPAPKRSLRPPSVYSAAPAGDAERY